MKDRDTSGGRTAGDDSSLTSYALTFLPTHEVLFGTSRSIFALMRSVLQVDDPIGRPQRQRRRRIAGPPSRQMQRTVEGSVRTRRLGQLAGT
jgi:hypothetical protein